MKYWPIYIITIVLFLLPACNEDPIAEVPVKNEIKFNTGVVLTRGVIESDENHIPQQEMIGIQVIRGTDGDTQQGFLTSNIASSASIAAGSGTIDLDIRQYFDEANNNAHFMAFYPEHNNYEAGKASWTIDGTQDIMVTKPVTAVYQGGREIAFEFEHSLAQVVLKLVAEDDHVAELYGDLLSAKINVPTQLELTISNIGVTALNKITQPDDSHMGEFDFGEMELRTDTVTSQGVLVYPDAAGLTEITLEFENRRAKSYPFSGVTLQAGHKTVVIATVKGHTVLFDVISLEPWEDATEPDNGNEVGLGKPGESL